MDIEKIAIITPLFNEEKNILNFIQCLVDQKNKNFHVYFIDDGSTDSTVSLLNQNLKSNIFSYTIISQKNQGAAQARLNAIKIVKEEYCLIIDCDDSISNDMINNIINVIKNSKVDTIVFDVMMQDKSGKYEALPCFDESRNIYNGFECLENSIGGWKISGLMCTKKNIFLKSYDLYHTLNTKKENFLNNDEIITRLNFLHSEKVIKINSIYYYQYNPNSTTKKINQKMHYIINNAIILHKLLNKYPIQNKIDKELFSTLWRIKKYISKNNKQIQEKQEWIYSLKKGCNYILTSKILKRQSFKNKRRFVITLTTVYFFLIFKRG